VCYKRLLGLAFSFENPIKREASFAVDGKTSSFFRSKHLRSKITTEIGKKALRKGIRFK